MTKRFTLIELLIVVAIIGILASLLAPALANARDRGKESVCKSNQRQIGMALLMYTDENSGKYPYSRTANPRHKSWDDLLIPYDGRKQPTSSEIDYPVLFASDGHKPGVYLCPSDTVQRTHWTGTDLVPASYALTWRVFNSHGNLTGWARGISGGDETANCQLINAVGRPSSTIAGVELASANRRIGHGEHSLMSSGWYVDKFIPHGGLKRSNYLMVDGSVKSMSFWQTLIMDNGTPASVGWSYGSMWDSDR